MFKREEGIDSLYKAGFEHPPAGNEFNTTSVYAFHHYIPPNMGKTSDYVAARMREARRLLSTPLVTEFELGNGDNSTDRSLEMDIYDNNLVSWISWEYKSYAGSLPNGTCTGCGKIMYFYFHFLHYEIYFYHLF